MQKYFFNLNCFLLIMLGGVTLGMFFQLSDFELITYVYHSDYLYLPALFEDLNNQNGNLKDWYLTPAPYFFPDMGLFFIVGKIFSNFRVALIVTNTLIYLLGFTLLIENLKLFFKKQSNSYFWIWAFALAFVYTALGYVGKFHHVQFLFSITNHSGNFVNTLIVIYLIQKYANNSQNIYFIIALLLSLLFALSDSLFLFSLVIPILCFAIWTHKSNIKAVLPQLVLVIIFIGLFFVLNNNLKTIFYHQKPQKYEPQLWIESLKNVWSYFGFLFRDFPVFVAMSFLGFVGMVVSIFRKNKHFKKMNVFVNLSLIITFAATIAGGLFFNNAAVRYFFHWIILAQIIGIITLILIYVPEKIRLVSALLLIFISSVVMIHSLIKNFERNKIEKFIDEDSAKIIETLKSLNLVSGVSNHWYANKLNLFSNSDLKIVSIYEHTFKPYFHICNSNNAYSQIFDFIIWDLIDLEKINFPQNLILDTIPINSNIVLFQTCEFRFNQQQDFEFIDK